MKLGFIVLLAVLQAGMPALAQNRQERREAKIAESAKVRSVPGAVTIEAAMAYEKAYDAVLNHFKRQGYTIDSADRDVGQIITAMAIMGGYTQTSTRIQVTLIRENDAKTTLRVAVTEQKRKKLLQTEAWGNPKVNEQESSRIADAVKSAIAQTQGSTVT